MSLPRGGAILKFCFLNFEQLIYNIARCEAYCICIRKQICRVRTWAHELMSWVPPRPRACPGHRWCYLRKAINKYIYCEIFTICFKLFNNYNYNYYLDRLYYNIIL